jgi:hypothetical protein
MADKRVFQARGAIDPSLIHRAKMADKRVFQARGASILLSYTAQRWQIRGSSKREGPGRLGEFSWRNKGNYMIKCS